MKRMTHKWYVALPLTLALATLTVAAFAQPLRTGKIGDRIDALTDGLQAVDGGPIGACGSGATVGYVDYVRPDLPATDENASFVGLTVQNHTVIVVAYDEDDLSTPVAVYADLDGNGTITNVWTVDSAPAPCDILSQLHYQP